MKDMKDKNRNLDDILDRGIDRIRSERADDTAAGDAARRVWIRVSAEAQAVADGSVVPISTGDRIRDCEGFLGLMPAHRRGELPAAKAMLLEDHVSECARCRAAMVEPAPAITPDGAGIPASHTIRQVSRGSWALRPAWALAAGLALVAVLAFGGLTAGLFDIPVGGTLQVAEIGEGLLRLDGERLVPLAVGETVSLGETLRTTKGSGAVLMLEDGSRMEVADRSELSVRKGWWNGTTVDLDRGSVIIEAADQGAGQLRVASVDCMTTVTGTVFAVNSGMKGSRVSVLEGEVHVNHHGENAVLGPGDQVTTNPVLGNVPLDEEIAWSRDLDRHLALFSELSEVRREFNRNVGALGLRTSSRLIHLVPDDTTIFAAVPNIASALQESHRMMVEKMETNPLLSEWWTSDPEAREIRDGMGRVIDTFGRFGEFLGDEIVMSIGVNSGSHPTVPVFVAELTSAGPFRDFAERQIAEINESAGHEALRLTEDPGGEALVTGGEDIDGLVMHVHDTMLIASPSTLRIQQVKERLAGATDGAFVRTPFFQAIEDSYRQGAGWVFGVDVERLMNVAAQETTATDRKVMERTGLMDARHLIVERRDLPSGTDQRAVLTFGSERTGIASWLADPAPMGSLRFVSPDASLAAAFVTKEPAEVLDDLFGLIAPSEPGFRDELREFESEAGFSIRDDLAASLGGEFAFAMDGPILPTPSWKVVFEVYDPASLQRTIERMIDSFNRESDKAGSTERMVLESTTVSGRPAWAVGSEGESFRIHYLYEDGYLVVSQSEALLDRALRNARAGLSLSASPKFLSLLPQDGHAHASAVMYQDAQSVLGALSGTLDRLAGELSPEQRAAVAKIAADAPPTLGLAWAGPDRISVAVSGDGDPIGGRLLSMMGVAGLNDLHASIAEIAAKHHAELAADGARPHVTQ